MISLVDIDPVPVASLFCTPVVARSLAERIADSAGLALTMIATATLIGVMAWALAPRLIRFLRGIPLYIALKARQSEAPDKDRPISKTISK